jgi:hypothetical protein
MMWENAGSTGVFAMNRMLAAATALAVVLPVSEAAATPFWFGWFAHDRPVVYRPIVTPETYYFQPMPAPEVLPYHRHSRPYVRHCRGPHRHHPHCR